jgi:hypothetical protein
MCGHRSPKTVRCDAAPENLADLIVLSVCACVSPRGGHCFQSDSARTTTQTPNPSFQGTAGKLRLPVRYGLRPSPAPELKR